MSGTSSSNNLVLQVLQMAKKTFARKLSANPLRRELVLPPDEFKSNLRELKQLMTGLKSSDLGLEHSETIKGTSGRRSPLSGLFRRTANEAPVTYIKVLEDIDVSVGIFIVKAGSRLPLHNHPNMYGLLKVVYGMVDVKIYSKFEPKSGEEDKLELPTMLQEDPSLFDQGIIFPTKTQILTNVNSTHNTLLLSPDEDNYHEIQSVGESPAAFFDILAPPYHTNEFDEEDDGHEPRDCHFFTEHKDISTGGNNTNNNIHSGKQPNILWLRRIPCPNDYTCSEEPYCGPRLK